MSCFSDGHKDATKFVNTRHTSQAANNTIARSTPMTHVVKPGETLGKIAKKFGVDYHDIARVNNIANPNNIRVGQKLKIPNTTPPKSSLPHETSTGRGSKGSGCKKCKDEPPQIIKKFLTPNRYSRPQRALTKVKAIVIHWVANPNTSAMANRNFFESRKNGKKSLVVHII